MLGEMDEQVILGNFVDEVYYKQCNHEGSDINKSPLLMSKSTSNMYHEGYDRKSLLCRLTTGDFNPRTHKGYDDTFPHPRLYFTEFQSTYPQRVRPYSVFLFFGSNHFNPRTHKGTTPVNTAFTNLKTFQSTYPQRVRQHQFSGSVPLVHFNPRTHKGYDTI